MEGEKKEAEFGKEKFISDQQIPFFIRQFPEMLELVEVHNILME